MTSDHIPTSDVTDPGRGREGSKPFEVGKTYLTQEGKSVTIKAKTTVPGYECVQGDDLAKCPERGVFTWIWRYNRESDRGRVTGSAFDMSDPRNLIPETK